MKNIKREGFTLVELLIVIVVIGVLSAMMMLSSTEAVSSAKAADIVSDLRNLKTAALAYYADHLDDVEKTGFNLEDTTAKTGTRAQILKYMNNDNIDDRYVFKKGTGNTNDQKKEWYVCYETTGTHTSSNQITDTVAKKLKSRASSTGLLQSAVSNDTYQKDTSNSVYMFIR